ncbi:MAG: GNAT family N-acetyltransferase [Desulfomonile tiedjei]|uniref:GNAT family N-acetyltransferase n=1 Tax=Desulfomonile tiedjei TaxID=2358 RepID=A0A9D6V110_9BACT|nr:GNAT family N-acetyltransferase [Desulfomonile tiedjei]
MIDTDEDSIASGRPISIRSWTDEDEAGLLDLHRLVSGEGDLSSPEFFDWQYRQNPAGRAFIGVAQEPGGMIVAQSAAIPVPLRMRGKRTMGSFALNSVTHPDYRRHGLFTKCAMKVFEDQIGAKITYTFSFPTLYSYMARTRTMEFRDLGTTHLLIKLHDPEALLADRGFSHEWFPLVTVGSWVLKAIQKDPRRIQEVEEVTSFDGLPVENLCEPGKVIVDADIGWLNWRYVANPKRRYRIAVARDAGEIVGIVVHGIEDTGPRRWGIIMDLMLSPAAGTRTVESLMNHVFSANIEAGCSVTLYMASPGSRKQFLLKRCGFWLVPKRVRSKGLSTGALLCRNNDSSAEDLRLEHIDLAFGMHDVL